MKVGLSPGVVLILKTLEFLESLKISFIHFGPWKSLKNKYIEEMKVRYGQPVMRKAGVQNGYQCHCIIFSCMHIVGDSDCAWQKYS